MRGGATEGPVGGLRKLFSPPWLFWSDKQSSSQAQPIAIRLIRSATPIYGRGDDHASGMAATYGILIHGGGALGRGRLGAGLAGGGRGGPNPTPRRGAHRVGGVPAGV